MEQNTALMEKIDNIAKKVDLVEADTGKLRSDTHDIKVDLEVLKVQMSKVHTCTVRLEESVFGINGKEGFDARMKELELKMEQNTEFRTDVKRLGWGLIALIAGDLALRVAGLI
jgi:hypothetical protein